MGENFSKFGNLLRIRQSFIRQFLVVSEKAIEAGLEFAKVFASQNFPLYSIQRRCLVFIVHIFLSNCLFAYKHFLQFPLDLPTFLKNIGMMR